MNRFAGEFFAASGGGTRLVFTEQGAFLDGYDDIAFGRSSEDSFIGFHSMSIVQGSANPPAFNGVRLNSQFVADRTINRFAPEELPDGIIINGTLTATAGDFDGDGKTDLLCRQNDFYTPSVSVALSNGTAFGTPAVWAHPSGNWCRFYDDFRIADFNGDGFMDLLAVSCFADWSDPGAVSMMVWLNDGRERFTPVVLAHKPTHLVTAAAGDLDGDGQYDVSELQLLLDKLEEDVDIVNGYKISRSDPRHRVLIGRAYQHLMRVLFRLNIRDVDCDFRLIRRRCLEAVESLGDGNAGREAQQG